MTCEFIFTWGIDYDTALECLPPIMSALVMLAKYTNGILHVQKLRKLCNLIKKDNERLMGLPEYNVLYTHAMEGRKFLVSFLGALGVLVVIYLIVPTVVIVNNVINKNESMDKYLMYPLDYVFMKTQDHYYIATVHCYLASLLIALILCSLDSMYITFTQHACGLFAVVGYQLKTVHVLNVDALRKEFGRTKCEELLMHEEERMYEKLVVCIKEHKRALEYTRILQSAFSVTLFVQIMLNIVLLSISGVQALFKLSERRYTDVVRLVTWMMGDHIHLFFLYLPGQRLLDFGTQVYYDALECMWYKGSIKFRVTYHIMIMRIYSPVKFSALKITPLNMEAFLAVTQAAVSYFTVLSSTL